ncbi:MAG TPA: isopentenyl-diphosphate Delta-isomerase [Bacteroidales bacterium]|nr:isopentenyl-diphosphate Delta-isomerase [Bacteroidales bacterium]
MEEVVLVDRNDAPLGTMEKMEAHLRGELHRAFSVFVFNSKGETMLQRRAAGKYHSPGLWTNTCCSHPRPGESPIEAAMRRMPEEMGFSVPLQPVFTFIYKAEVGQGLTEHEFDHVMIGSFEGEPLLNPEEADEWKWMHPDAIALDMEQHPENYTVWFRIALPELRKYLATQKINP